MVTRLHVAARYSEADIADIGRMNAVWDVWVVPGHTPPRSTVQAALADPRWLIEVVVVARQRLG